MRTSGLLCCLLMVIVLPAGSTTLVVFDGEWWSSLDRGEKVMAVQGMLAGYEWGFKTGATRAATGMANRTLALLRKAHLSQAQLSEAEIQYNYQAGTVIASLEPSLGSPSFGTIVDRLDAIYNGHPKLAREEIGLFVECAASDSGDCSLETATFHP